MATWKKVLVEGLDLTGSDVSNNAKDLVIGQGLSLDGTAATEAASQETNNVMLGADGDVTIAIDIAGQTNLGNSVASGDLLLVADIDDSNKVKKTSVSDLIAAVSTGVTTFNANRNLTESNGDTDGVIDLDLDKDLISVNSIAAEGATDGVDSDTTGTNLVIKAGASTGNVGGGEIQLRTARAGGSSGTAINNPALAVTVKNDGDVDFTGTVTVQTSGNSSTGLSLSDKNITNVGDIALDSISADLNDIVVNLTDNRAAALDIKQGSNSYLTFITTDGSEEIVASKNLRIEGDLTVNGDTTTVSTSTLTVEDKRIVAANPDSNAASNAAQATNASGGGLALNTHLTAGTDDANYAAVTWSSTGYLTGWRFRDTAGGTDYAASIMELNLTSATAPTADSAGIGSFYFAAADGSTEGDLYIRTL